MRPSEVRDHVLDDHQRLRRQLGRLERLAMEVTRGDRLQIGELRSAGEELLTTLLRHMDWEDRQLAPALADADGWGAERANRLTSHHVEQREELSSIVADLQDQRRPPLVLATTLLQLVRHLRLDMQEEEGFFLDPNVLRDDVVGIDVEAG
jgi:iron-sulfur cluster repair protein YtfE (RIC family)